MVFFDSPLWDATFHLSQVSDQYSLILPVTMKINRFVFFLTLICTVQHLTVSHLKAQEITDRVNQTYEGVKNLEVKASFCEVILKVSPSDKVYLRGELEINIRGLTGANEEDFKIRHQKEGETLRVWVERPERNWVIGSMRIDGKIEISLPENLNVFVDNSSGSVLADGLKGGKVHLEASSGNVSAKNLKTNPTLKTSSGGINAENIVGNVSCKSSSGSQHLKQINGDIVSVASSGRLVLENVKGSILAETSSGAIRLVNVEGQLQLRASSGSIRGENVLLTGNSKFHTSSGAIRMDLRNQSKDLSYDLTASSGSLHVNDTRSGKRILIKEGQTMITGVSSSGSQRYQTGVF